MMRHLAKLVLKKSWKTFGGVIHRLLVRLKQIFQSFSDHEDTTN